MEEIPKELKKEYISKGTWELMVERGRPSLEETQTKRRSSTGELKPRLGRTN